MHLSCKLDSNSSCFAVYLKVVREIFPCIHTDLAFPYLLKFYDGGHP